MRLISKSGRVVELRQPSEGDEARLMTYALELGAEDTFVLLNPAVPVTWTEEVEYLASTLRKLRANWQVHYLMMVGEKIVGSCQITVQGRRKMHIGGFGISLLKEYRRDGLGEQLARLVIEEAKLKLGVRMITLEMFSANNIARGLYQKLGFKEYGSLPQGLKYKEAYNDAVLMYKEL
jgi:RimJ/RimL family protein N-acetyltransferase